MKFGTVPNFPQGFISEFLDRRLLLAIHLGCFIIQNLRVTTQENRKIATRISESLSNLVQVYMYTIRISNIGMMFKRLI